MSAEATPPILQMPAGHQPPQLGAILGQGGEGTVFRNLSEPGWVVKVFKPGGNPLATRNQLDNLARARAMRPDNVVQSRPLLDPANPRDQNWLIAEEVLPSTVPEDSAAKAQLQYDLRYFPDSGSNLMWGTTLSNAISRWILIE